MNKEYTKGMYCSRRYADWMLKKNCQDLDFPATSYQKLIRLFSRTNYTELFVEEARKGNEFYYSIVEDDDCIRLKSSYEIVFLPYEGRIGEDDPDSFYPATEPLPVDELILGYRVLQTRGCLPGTPEEAFSFADYFSMQYIVDEFKLNAKQWEKYAKEKNIDIEGILELNKKNPDYVLGYNPMAGKVKFDDVYRFDEFQRAEEKGFIDNQWPFSAGPECPDKIICYLMYSRIIRQLMREADRLALVPNRNADFYELRVASYVAAILSIMKHDKEAFVNGVKKNTLLQTAELLFKDYSSEENDFLDTCHRIRIALLWDANVVMNLAQNGSVCDYDYDDMEEAPIGLTEEDRERFDNLSDDVDEGE